MLTLSKVTKKKPRKFGETAIGRENLIRKVQSAFFTKKGNLGVCAILLPDIDHRQIHVI